MRAARCDPTTELLGHHVDSTYMSMHSITVTGKIISLMGACGDDVLQKPNVLSAGDTADHVPEPLLLLLYGLDDCYSVHPACSS